MTRFTLDEGKAAEWLAHLNEHAEDRSKCGPECRDAGDVGRHYRASSGEYADETAGLLAQALQAGIITDAGHVGYRPALAWQFIPSDGTSACAHRWILTADDLAVTSPADDLWGIGLGPDNREIAGVPSALAFLRQSADAGNGLSAGLDAYVQAQARPGSDALGKIAHMLGDPRWGAGMLEDIAEIVRNAGHEISDDPDGPSTWDRH